MMRMPELSRSLRVIHAVINTWRLTWVSVEVHCSGYSEFRFRSFFCWRCSGITSRDLKPVVPDSTFSVLCFCKAAN
jgi:hypothetical protein